MNQPIISRIEPLDWLRGLMAIAIMFYHLTSWHISSLDSSHFLGRLGIYGVSIFFVLSGLSMAIVYSSFIINRQTATAFFIRRIFRIWPLLWVCVILVTIPSLFWGKEISIAVVLINLTTLFGFISPGSYLNTGAWSIGNEMVYYALTPFLIFSYKKNRSIGNGLLTLSLLVGLFFAFVMLDSQRPLADQWHTYINPFNNVFLYVAGIAIYFNLNNIKIEPFIVASLFFTSIAIFFFFPVTGNQIAITTGFNRIIFMLASIMLVTAFYKFSQQSLIPKSIRYPLEQLGIATYGVYMLHPLVNNYVGYALRKMGMQNPVVLFAAVVLLTIALAIVSFTTFEIKIMKYGKEITSSKSKLWTTFNLVRSINRSSGHDNTRH